MLTNAAKLFALFGVLALAVTSAGAQQNSSEMREIQLP